MYISENKDVVIDVLDNEIVCLFVDGVNVPVTPDNIRSACKKAIPDYGFFRNYTDAEIMMKRFHKTNQSYGLFRFFEENASVVPAMV